MTKNLPIYLDNHATTPLDPIVLECMTLFLTTQYGNPSNKIHYYGQQAYLAVEKARAQVARVVDAKPGEIFFTSGATESNNLSITGAAQKNRIHGNHIITTQIEHGSVLKTAQELCKQGFKVTFVAPDKFGCISARAISDAITPATILISVMAANNEIGTINPIDEIAQVAAQNNILFHTDAVQAIGSTAITAQNNTIDFMSLSAHKIYGPKGVGALFVRECSQKKLAPIIFGGDQESGIRAGTLNSAGIVGLGAACELVKNKSKDYRKKIASLRDLLENTLRNKLENIYVNGSPKSRLAGNLNVSFTNLDGGSLSQALSHNIAFSTASACCANGSGPSYVLRAAKCDYDKIHATFRFGVGKFNTKEEIQTAARQIICHVKSLTRRKTLSNQTKLIEINAM